MIRKDHQCDPGNRKVAGVFRKFLQHMLHIFMNLQNFKDWLLAQETTAFTRSRKAAAQELGPDIPDASINSHDTASPWIQNALKKKHHKKKKED